MPTRDDAPLGAPCWIDLFSSDIEAAIAFYGDLLGWTCEDSGPEFGHYRNFSKDGHRVAGGIANDGSGGMADVWTVYLAVADAQATVDAAAAAGGAVPMPPMEMGALGWAALITDAGGAAVGIWQPGEHRGFGLVDEPGAPAWFELHTRAYEPSVAFYETVFGWDTTVASDVPEFRYTTLGDGEDSVAGVMDASAFLPEGVPGQWSVYFRVDDADASVAEVARLGGSLVAPPEDTPYGRLATVADPTGTAFKLIQP